jgi:alcohol dehydrogenase class IV
VRGRSHPRHRPCMTLRRCQSYNGQFPGEIPDISIKPVLFYAFQIAHPCQGRYTVVQTASKMAASGEKYFAARPPDGRPFISHGLPFEKAVAHHAENTYGARRVFLVVSKSIGETDNFTRLKTELGESVIGVHKGIRTHSPFEDVLAVAANLRETKPDLIVTLGAGSITDGVKVANLAAANGTLTPDELEDLYELNQRENDSSSSSPEDRPRIKSATIPVINIPTTLSGAEYTSIGGATKSETHHKATFRHPSLLASLVVLDPVLSLSTPRQVWLASGMRGVDHCVEGICGTAPGGKEEVRMELEESLRMLLMNLLINVRGRKEKEVKDGNKDGWEDMDARLQEMLAVIPLADAVKLGFGASHGIGHQLGPLGVGHGETSCVMLPAVLKYNYEHGDERVRALQSRVVDVFWGEETVAEMLTANGLEKGKADAGDLVDAFVRELGLPRSLEAVGVQRDRFEALAVSSLKDWATKQNPVKLNKEGVLEILEMAATG